MTKTADRIAVIAEHLSPEAQRALLDIAESLATPTGFYEGMTQEQLSELDRSIGEALRDEVIDQAALDAHLDTVCARRA